jgi:hypothetical protein
MSELSDFLRHSVPSEWFSAPPSVSEDDDEVICTGALSESTPAEQFRDATRDQRIAIAAEAESRFGRKVSWAVEQGGTTIYFTQLSVPVMTRLRFRERAVLDTLIDGGVARSRSDAIAWCVKLVAQHQNQWLDELREALADVEHVRAEGPQLL